MRRECGLHAVFIVGCKGGHVGLRLWVSIALSGEKAMQLCLDN